MKHVFTTSQEIAHEFIAGTFDGQEKRNKSNNASTDGERFWSYCTTIAKKYGEYIAIDSYRYSMTTAKQAREIEAAAYAANLETFRVPEIHRLNNAANVEYYATRINAANAKIRRARSEGSRDYWRCQLRDLLHGWRSLVDCCRAEGLEIANITL